MFQRKIVRSETFRNEFRQFRTIDLLEHHLKLKRKITQNGVAWNSIDRNVFDRSTDLQNIKIKKYKSKPKNKSPRSKTFAFPTQLSKGTQYNQTEDIKYIIIKAKQTHPSSSITMMKKLYIDILKRLKKEKREEKQSVQVLLSIQS